MNHDFNPMRPRLGPTWAASSLAVLALSMALGGCQRAVPDAPGATAAIPATAFAQLSTIQELMQGIVDPTADALWESVSSTTTAKGVEDKRPQTDAEWLQLKHLAVQLTEAGNLLSLTGRKVSHDGKVLEDAHVSATLAPADIQQRIDADPAAFASFGQALAAAAHQAQQAVEQRNVDAFMQAGEQIDRACESCHQRYWYPNDKRPKS